MIRDWPRRDLPVRRLALLVFLGALGFLGVRLASHSAPTAKPSLEPEATPTNAGTFSELRPRTGDHMALPRIGFRWTFDGQAASPKSASTRPGASKNISQASMVPRFLSGSDSSREDGAVRYVLHLAGPGGTPEITKESSEPSLRLNLKKDFPTGECEWWIEAFVPGQPPATSPRERFTLSP